MILNTKQISQQTHIIQTTFKRTSTKENHPYDEQLSKENYYQKTNGFKGTKDRQTYRQIHRNSQKMKQKRKFQNKIFESQYTRLGFVSC